MLRLGQDALEGELMTWAWFQGKKPVFNFVSEGRDFTKTERVLIAATSFYEYTAPAERKPKIKLQDQHQFTLSGEAWFWIAGIVRDGCFAMLTVAPGADVAPFHGRQIVVLPPERGMSWLRLDKAQAAILQSLPGGSLHHQLLRKDGVVLQ